MGVRGTRQRSLGQRLLSGGSWALLAKCLTLPTGLGIALLLARLLSPSDLGAYFLAMSLVGITAALVQLGLGRAMVRLVASALATHRPGAARQAVRIGITVTALSASAAAVLLVDGLGTWLTELLEGGERLRIALPWIALLVVAFAATELAAEILRGFQDLRAASALTEHLLQRLILLALLWTLWIGAYHPRVEQVLLLALGAATVAAVVGLVLVRSHVADLAHHGARLRPREVLLDGPPFLLLRFNLWLLADAGVWVLGMLRPTQEVAVYGAANQLGLLVLAPLFVVNAVIAPVVAELYSQGRIAKLEQAVRGAAACSLLAAVALVVVLAGFGDLALGLVFGEPYAEGHVVLVVLAVGRALAIAFGSGAIVLIMTHHQREVVAVTAGTSVMALAGFALAAPIFGAVGIATVIALAVAGQSALFALLARRRLGIATWPELSAEAFARLRLELGRARRRR